MNISLEMKRSLILPEENIRLNNILTTKVEVLLQLKTPESISDAEKILTEIDE